MKSELTIKQLLRKKYFDIKKNFLQNNKDKVNNYHWELRENIEKLVGGLIEKKEILIKNDQLLVGTYLPIPERQIIPPSFTPKFQQKFGIKAQYFTPYFTSKNRRMQFLSYDMRQKKSIQFCLGPFGVKTPKIQQQGHIINSSNLNVLFVPLICIQKNCLQRIGYGGGYYDQYIKQSKLKKTVSIGIALQDLVIDQDQLKQNQKKLKLWNQWDQSLDYAITQKTIIRRKQTPDQIKKSDIFHDSLQLQFF